MKTIITFLLLVFFLSAHAQITISYGPEMGINSSGILYLNSYINADRGDVVKERNLPQVSPVAGGFISLHAGKHFFISEGANIKMVGNIERDIRTGTQPGSANSFISDSYVRQSFTSVSFPTYIGYNFKTKKREFQFKAGINFNYFATGNYFEQHIYNVENQTHSLNIYSQDPFDIGDYNYPATRWNNQLAISFGFNIGNKMNIWFAGAYGSPVDYQFLYYDGGWCSTGMGYAYQNLDLSIKMQYNLHK